MSFLKEEERKEGQEVEADKADWDILGASSHTSQIRMTVFQKEQLQVELMPQGWEDQMSPPPPPPFRAPQDSMDRGPGAEASRQVWCSPGRHPLRRERIVNNGVRKVDGCLGKKGNVNPYTLKPGLEDRRVQC
jgi:hypothetical protein